MTICILITSKIPMKTCFSIRNILLGLKHAQHKIWTLYFLLKKPVLIESLKIIGKIMLHVHQEHEA